MSNFYTELDLVDAHEEEHDCDLVLTRKYYENGVQGVLRLPNHLSVATLERPWLDNQRSISCIPEGTYTLRKRNSAVVERTSRGEFPEGWEVTDVPGRTYIMFHVGNYIRDSEGCVLVGYKHGFHEGQPVVWSSMIGMRIFMEALNAKDEWTLLIKSGESV